MAVRKTKSGRQLLWLAVAVVLLGLAGYAQAEGSAPEVLTLGVRSDCPPFSYFDEATKEYRGYSVDLCRVIALNAQAFLPYQRVAFEPVTAQ
ncbi:MAG: transporter substrate-binding domain-containing protein, partial [Desulfobacterales bacterium]|nr:transporter substrate-binding domain-containing protein [Desulfobacterales bacterium]